MKKALTVLENAYISQRAPISLVHFIAMQCNARCKHCFIDFDDPQTFKDELSLEEIRVLSKSLGDSIINVNLTGGEPFLRRDIYEIAEAYFVNAGIESLYITTNGMYTDRMKAFIDKFVASKLQGKLIFAISIDNFEEGHDENRRVKGLFKKAIESYRMIREYGLNTIVADIALTVTHHNCETILDLYDFLKDEYGVDAFTVTAMREEGIIRSIDPVVKRRIHAVYRQLADRIREDVLSRRTRGFQDTLQGRIMNSKNMISFDVLKKVYEKPQYLSHCPAGALFGVIYSNGDVYPCEILDDRKLGNLRDYGMNFMDLWGAAAAADAKNFIKESKCNCSYECAWSLNIISNKQYIPRLVMGVVRSFFP